MRWVICAVVVLAFAPRASAQDYVLRGSEPTYRWAGFYFGGQAAYSGGSADFTGATQGPLGYALRDTQLESDFEPSQWPLLGSASASAASYGAFVGFNSQWQDLVLGGEVDYSRTNMNFTAPGAPMERLLTTSNSTTQTETLYDVTAAGSGTLHLLDYGSLRARAGWIFDNNFLPYGFAGFAIGRGNYTVLSAIGGPTATTAPTPITIGGITTIYTPAPVLPCDLSVPETCSSFSASSSSGGNMTYLYGFDFGVGVDIALISNLFVRGEFEYVHFLPLKGITLDLATARIGAGLKF